MKVSIAFATKVRLLSESIKESLQARGYDTRGILAEPSTALQWIGSVRPYFLVIDKHCPAELVREARARDFIREVILLTDDVSAAWARNIELLRIRGVVSFYSSFAELTFCIQEILDGRKYVSESIRVSLEQAAVPEGEPAAPTAVLTPREAEILDLIGRGYTNQRIGRELFLSPNTVNNHRAKIIRKLNLKGAHQLLKVALERNGHEAGDGRFLPLRPTG